MDRPKGGLTDGPKTRLLELLRAAKEPARFRQAQKKAKHFVVAVTPTAISWAEF